MIDPNQLTLGFAVGKMKAIEVSASSVASSAHCNFRTDETAQVVLPDRLQPQFLPKTTDSITETVSSLLNDHNCKSTVSGGTKNGGGRICIFETENQSELDPRNDHSKISLTQRIGGLVCGCLNRQCLVTAGTVKKH